MTKNSIAYSFNLQFQACFSALRFIVFQSEEEEKKNGHQILKI